MSKVGLAVAGGTLAIGSTLYYTQGSAGQPDGGGVTVTVDAAPRVVDEGTWVEFLAKVESRDGGSPPAYSYEWDFDDGSARVVSAESPSRRHRFVDDGTPTVAVRVDRASVATVAIEVRNVPPTILSVTHSRPVLQGGAVTFEAIAADPGLRDRLTYTWDFGDGGTGRGPRPRHTFSADGRYDVTVTVDDGDGGQDRRSLPVIVGQGFELTAGGAAEGTQKGWVYVSSMLPDVVSRAAPSAADNDLCHVSINFVPAAWPTGGPSALAALPSFGLTIATYRGLRAGRYVVGASVPFVNVIEERAQNADVFFAGLSATLAQPVPDAGPYFRSGSFYASNGTVSIDYLEPNWIEGSFEIPRLWLIAPQTMQSSERFEERIATVSGRFAGTFVPERSRGMRVSPPWEVYNCREPVETFDLASRTPVASAENIDPVRPELQITFTKPVDPATIAGRVRLEYGRPAEGAAPPQEYRAVPGSWALVPGDDRTVRFVPQAHLLDGVIHCVRVRTGREGLRGRKGEVLSVGEPALGRNAPACEGGRPWPGAHEWAFSTLVEVESVGLAVYQASQAAPNVYLVPGKPSVARVYVDWTKKPEVNEWSQVKQFPARVAVRRGESPITVPERAEIKRPDLFSADDKRQARHTVNLFGWDVDDGGGGRANLRAVIEAVDAVGAPVRSFESQVLPLPYWWHSPVLPIHYYFLQVNGCVARTQGFACEDWSQAVPAHWQTAGRQLAVHGAQFTTQNFPVVDVNAQPAGDVPIDEPPSGACPWDATSRCYFPPEADGQAFYADGYLLDLLTSARGLVSGRQYIVMGLVPPGISDDWLGSSSSKDNAFLIDIARGDPSALAHEAGHVFGLGHCPEEGDQSPSCPDIRGFRLHPSGRSGLNKHGEEGNQEAPALHPLMHYKMQMPSGQNVLWDFINTSDYRKLFDAIENEQEAWQQVRLEPPLDPTRPLRALASWLLPRPVYAQTAAPASVRVSGVVAGDRVALHRVVYQPGVAPPPAGPAPGGLTLDLLDVAGRVVSSVPFAVDVGWHARPGVPAAFTVEVPAPAGLHTVRVTAPGGRQTARTRSAHPPVITAEVTPATGTTPLTLRWATQDPDGDAVRVDVFVRGDDGPWRAAGLDLTRTMLRFDPHQLPPGRRVTARLVAADGFNTTITEVNVGPGAPLAVVATLPGNGEVGVDVSTDVSVYLSAPLRTARPATVRPVPMDAARLRLADPAGTTVFADVVYRPASSALILTPVQPLRPATRYTVTLAPGLEDLSGSRLTEALTWSFVTAAEEPEDDAPPAGASGARPPAAQ